MKKFLLMMAFLSGILMAAVPAKAHAGVYYTFEDVYDSTGWKYGENVYANNPFNYTVEVDPYMYSSANVTWSLVPVTIAPGGTILVGWVADLSNQEAWNFEIKGNVTPVY